MNADEFCKRIFDIYDEADKLTSTQIIAKLKAVQCEDRLNQNTILSKYFIGQAEKELKEARAFVKYSNTKQAKNTNTDLR